MNHSRRGPNIVVWFFSVERSPPPSYFPHPPLRTSRPRRWRVRPKQPAPTSRTVPTVVALILTLVPGAWGAPKYKVLHSFGKGKDGAGTWGSLLLDKKENLYGTTGGGGLYGYGTAFELMPKSNGNWSETILHNFDRNGQDGYGSTANLTFGTKGNVYGTTTYGGSYDAGTVFELVLSSDGWVENVLYSFGSHQNDAFSPSAGIAIDKSDNLFGTGQSVYEVVRASGGDWTESVIHDFTRRKGDAADPSQVLSSIPQAISMEPQNTVARTIWVSSTSSAPRQMAHGRSRYCMISALRDRRTARMATLLELGR
jgi:uncharacterized repeat protein (TIGR03803 family)